MTKTRFQAGSALVLAGLISFPNIAAATDFTLKVGGRVHLDYTLGDLNTPDMDLNGGEIRRARLNVSGKYGDAIKYKFEVNHETGDDITVKDAYLQFIPQNSPFKIKVGQFKTHVSLDEQNSSRFMSTLERSAFTDAFDFGRRLGVSVNTSGDNYTFDAGVFTADLEDDPDGSYALSARGTYNPVKTDDTLVHLGVSWRYRNQDAEDGELLRFRQRPYTHSTSFRIVQTDRFAGSDNFFGAEAAIFHKNLWAAGEYGYTAANGTGAEPDADFNGFYGEVGAFIGGRRTYKGGKFNRPKVDNPLGEGGMGALAFVARYDRLDLQDNIRQGELETIVIGADWWPTKYTRLGLNYFNVDAENGAAGSGNGVVGRIQFDF